MKKYDDIRFQELKEGLYDPNIFKAFFLAGGPGSGKTFVTKSTFSGTGLKTINSDASFERGLKKSGLSMKMPDDEAEARDIDKIAYQNSLLKQLGYDTYMVFVNTSLEVALERNAQRERTVPEYITIKSWKGVQANIGKFQNLFGMSNMIIIDNNKSDKELVTQTMSKVGKSVRSLLSRPIQSYTAKRWMATERKLRRK